jgi:inhibitor of growth protein 3
MSSARANSVYTLSLLSEYTHTLDSLPLDLSRNFADLRELDAVLSSSMASITHKIKTLTQMIEQGSGKKEERLWLLTEIAEEAARLKPGGEDKIRVACQAADSLKSHINHLKDLAENIPEFNASTLNMRTTYPHVAAKSFMPLTAFETSRRRRGGIGSLLTSATDPSPAKRKRTVKDDDLPPRKDRPADSRQRNNRARAKRIERPPSPAESVVSVTSHPNGVLSRTNSSNNKRSRPNRAGSPARDEYYSNGLVYDHVNGRNSRGDFNVPPSSSHPSLPLPYHMNGNGYPLSGPASDWAASHNQLEGPGMPVTRPTFPSPPPVDVSEPMVEVNDGDADGDGDDNKQYCFCHRGSFGEMIACDEPTCEVEWYHLNCIGLTIAPEGAWICDTCKTKKNGKRTNRGGKRKGGGNRSGGRVA